MVAYYHANPGDETFRLDLHHTLPLGEPYLDPRSQLTHWLVSRPYPFGLDLETCHVGDVHVDLYWVLPISESEKQLVRAESVEALEERLEAAAIDPYDPLREPVV